MLNLQRTNPYVDETEALQMKKNKLKEKED